MGFYIKLFLFISLLGSCTNLNRSFFLKNKCKGNEITQELTVQNFSSSDLGLLLPKNWARKTSGKDSFIHRMYLDTAYLYQTEMTKIISMTTFDFKIDSYSDYINKEVEILKETKRILSDGVDKLHGLTVHTLLLFDQNEYHVVSYFAAKKAHMIHGTCSDGPDVENCLCELTQIVKSLR